MPKLPRFLAIGLALVSTSPAYAGGHHGGGGFHSHVFFGFGGFGPGFVGFGPGFVGFGGFAPFWPAPVAPAWAFAPPGWGAPPPWAFVPPAWAAPPPPWGAQPSPWTAPPPSNAPAPPAPPPPAAPPSGAVTPPAETAWYFCPTAKGYYPYVARCTVAWQRVPTVPPDAQPRYASKR